MKRFFDIIVSFILILLLSPILIILSIMIKLDSSGRVFFMQIRVGRYAKMFKIMKFRTMRTGSDKSGLLTVGNKDTRITKIGYYLRKYKFDELPQLFNVFIGDMSIVGPRPEVQKYVDLYTAEQRKVLTVKPGITDYASIEYSNENEILGRAQDPEKEYIERVMPDKLKLNMKYIETHTIFIDIKLIVLTIIKIIK